MPDQAVRAPASLPRAPGGPGGLVAGPALTRVLPLAPTRARGAWPLDPRPEVVRGFDPPEVTYGAGHRGVDLHARVGQQVRTALAGEVSFAGRLAGRGVVVVSHGATRTTYEPVTASVHRGDHVDTGQSIGTLQWSGSHRLPLACLHWGLRRGDTYLDPLTLVGGGPQPVRLYPW
jgi:murein DD-endopeptidase MepM/ murein hydrolase activator NlpD